MHERGVILPAHDLDHAERGERIDEAGRAFGRCGSFRKNETSSGLHNAVLSVHAATEGGDGFANELLRVRACFDDDTARLHYQRPWIGRGGAPRLS